MNHIMLLRSLLVSAICVLFLGSAQAAAPSVLFYGGDGYVANGKTEWIRDSDGYAFAVDPFNTSSLVQITAMKNTQDPDGSFGYFSLWLSAWPGDALHRGHYQDVGTAPFAFAGVNFSGNNRGVNSVFGSSFNILDIQFDSRSVLSSLAVDFVQRDEGGFLGTTYGSLRYQSAIPIPAIPEPPQSAMLLVGLLLAAGLSRRRRG